MSKLALMSAEMDQTSSQAREFMDPLFQDRVGKNGITTLSAELTLPFTFFQKF